MRIALGGIIEIVDQERRKHREKSVRKMNELIETREFPYWALLRTQVSLELESHRQGMPLVHDLAPVRGVGVLEDGTLLTYCELPEKEVVEIAGRITLFDGDAPGPDAA